MAGERAFQTPKRVASMAKREEWEEKRALGQGGQSEVFLVRSPERVVERGKRLQKAEGRRR